MCAYAQKMVGLFAFGASVVFGVSSSHSQTMEERLTTVETKTSFYSTSRSKVTLKYRQGHAMAKCSNGQMTIAINPKVVVGGTLYSWPSVLVRFRDFPGPDREVVMTYASSSKLADRCTSTVTVPGTDTAKTLKSYCALNVAPADKINFSFQLNNSSQDPPDACELVASIDFDIKLISVGVREPD